MFPLELHSASENIYFLPMAFLTSKKALFSPLALPCRCYVLSNENGKIQLSLRQSRYVTSLQTVDLLLFNVQLHFSHFD